MELIKEKEKVDQQIEEYSFIITSDCNKINTKHKYNGTNRDTQI